MCSRATRTGDGAAMHLADAPTTTPGTPEAIRALELEAIAADRSKYPKGPPWQQLADTTRRLWVWRAERPRQGARSTAQARPLSLDCPTRNGSALGPPCAVAAEMYSA